MITHKYQVGDLVSFVHRSALLNKAGGEYDIVRLMPNDDQSDDPQYRLKSGRESHERVARESELRRVALSGKAG